MEQGVYRLFAGIQTTHWWFVARRIILEDVLTRFLPSRHQRIAELGCGTGIMTRMLSAFGETWGIDNSPEAVTLCREQHLERIHLFDDPAWREVRFDGMAFFDVIEHVQDDAAFLTSCLTQLKDGGWVVITVPAFMFLWSEHDELNNHYRRYTRKLLLETMSKAGLVPERISYFNTWLFLPIAIARVATRTARAVRALCGQRFSKNLRTDFERNIAALNGLLCHIFASERFVLRFASFPVGTSLLALARKPHLTGPSHRES